MMYLIKNYANRYVLTDKPLAVLKKSKAYVVGEVKKLTDLNFMPIGSIFAFDEQGMHYYVPEGEVIRIYVVNERSIDLVYEL